MGLAGSLTNEDELATAGQGVRVSSNDTIVRKIEELYSMRIIVFVFLLVCILCTWDGSYSKWLNVSQL